MLCFYLTVSLIWGIKSRVANSPLNTMKHNASLYLKGAQIID